MRNVRIKISLVLKRSVCLSKKSEYMGGIESYESDD